MHAMPSPNLDLWSLVEKVTDRESFLAFARALELDCRDEVAKEKESPSSPYGRGANGWENGSIENYLEAATRWSEDWIRKDDNVFPREPSWRTFAEFLHAGKFYE